jgi:hypothetical protein
VQPPGEVALRPPHPRLGRERLEGVLRRARRAPDRAQLVLVLDRAQRLDDTRGRDELEPSLPQRLDLRVRKHVRFEGDAAVEALGEVGEERPLRLLRLDAAHALRRLDVAEVGEESRAAPRLDEERGVRCVEPGEVADVREVRDEQPLVEPLDQPLEPGHARAARNSSASR